MCEDVLKEVWKGLEELVMADHVYHDKSRALLAVDFELHRALDHEATRLSPDVEVFFSEIALHCQERGHAPEDLVWDPQYEGSKWDDDIKDLFRTEGFGCCNNCYSQAKSRAINQVLVARASLVIDNKVCEIAGHISDE